MSTSWCEVNMQCFVSYSGIPLGNFYNSKILDILSGSKIGTAVCPRKFFYSKDHPCTAWVAGQYLIFFTSLDIIFFLLVLLYYFSLVIFNERETVTAKFCDTKKKKINNSSKTHSSSLTGWTFCLTIIPMDCCRLLGHTFKWAALQRIMVKIPS